MKTWLITGISSGLGREAARQLLDRGDRVVGTVRQAKGLDDLSGRHGDAFTPLTLDLTDASSIRAAVDQAFAAYDRIDVVFGNAGYGVYGAAEELSDEDIDRQIATNLTGSIQLICAVIPHLRGQGGGRIVQMSSGGGQVAYPNFSLYHATKWGIEGFVESVRQEVAAFGIDFLLVEPGPTDTRFAANLKQAEPMAAYEGTIVAQARQAFAEGRFGKRESTVETVRRMIAAADAVQPPLRLILGAMTWEHVERALSDRLEAARAQRDGAMLG